MSEPAACSYVAAHAAFRSGADTPRDFLERCLARMDEWEGKIHAFVSTNNPAARAAADTSSARWRAGRPLSPIDGMPIGIKDIIETADLPTEQGSPLFKGWRSVRDSAGVAALREAGAVIVGKTVTTEFAAVEPGSVGHVPHAGGIEQRVRGRRCGRHRLRCLGHAGHRLDRSPRELLRMLWL
jgi:Asp-tRNA(Asn)/Glu-tRNA(Gln) amidotransferase A subunit family amidase